MKIEQKRWTEEKGWFPELKGTVDEAVQLVLLFGATQLLKDLTYIHDIKSAYPKAHLFGCSTAGEICSTQITDNSLVITAVSFEYTQIKCAQVKIRSSLDSLQAGEILARSLEKDDLVHVIVLSDGINVNGSDLSEGLNNNLPEGVSITGGLAGDGERFQETLVFCDDIPARDTISVLGLYGKSLKVGYGSLGGWDPFGPERLITRSKGNILYELDGKSALELYKRYLGEHAKNLPASGLLFPLSIRAKEGENGLVRTILSVNEEEQSLTFAGDVPEGVYARLMKANFDRLIDGAIDAAKKSYLTIGSFSPELAILISCVGRKMILKQRTEEEVEGVRDILGDKTVLAGFYSYGEICPFTLGTKCDLHNQTMTITVLSEK
ncbi:MAG: FIST N-terminal domain-containing protein [Thermodesulfovibrionales bacterium]